jgi:exodeoxyribonuclease V alpha subunit
MNLNSDQLRAVEMARGRRLSIVSGGAGTGKTTVIKEIAQACAGAVLVAPTGKAAARLREASGHETATIHRLLGYNGAGFQVKKLTCPVIIDEASMVDAMLLAAVCRCSPPKLVLVGDNMQLFPVGAGAPFHDLFELRPDCRTHLCTCYRSAAAVCQAGNEIRAGKWPGDNQASGGERFRFIPVAGAEAAHKAALELATASDWDPARDVIISPKNGALGDDGEPTPATVAGLNADLMAILNPGERKAKFIEGDRIICGQNFSDLDVWNGTTGTVAAVDMDGRLWVKTDQPTANGEQALFGKPQIKASSHAWALTIHKAQGSQYRRVVVIVLNRDQMMLTRQLLYTAVTRAQVECVVIGERFAVQKALSNLPRRNTIMRLVAGKVGVA